MLPIWLHNSNFRGNPPISDWVIGMQKHKDYDAVIRFYTTTKVLGSFDNELSATVDDLAADLQHLPLEPQTPTKENTLFLGRSILLTIYLKEAPMPSTKPVLFTNSKHKVHEIKTMFNCPTCPSYRIWMSLMPKLMWLKMAVHLKKMPS